MGCGRSGLKQGLEGVEKTNVEVGKDGRKDIRHQTSGATSASGAASTLPTWRYEPVHALDQYVKPEDSGVDKLLCKYINRENSGFDYFEKDEYLQLRDTLDEKYGRHLLLQYAKDVSIASHLLLASWILMHKYHMHKNPADRYRLGTELLDKLIKPQASDSIQQNGILEITKEHPDVEMATESTPLKNNAQQASTKVFHGAAGELLDVANEHKDEDVHLALTQNGGAKMHKMISKRSSDTLEKVPNDVVKWCKDMLECVRTELLEFGERADAPKADLFLPLQGIVFKDMMLLHAHFKADHGYCTKLTEIKRIVYNKVKPDDFIYCDIIGKGGFGKVVQVIKKSTKQPFAMKIQAKDRLLATWGQTMENVEIERDVLVANQQFPFIISLRYAFQTEKYAFLVLDLAEAGALSHVLSQQPGNSLDESHVRLYAAEIVLALESLHEHGIIYRDLKPANVLLCRDGHITLADMGLAGFYYQKKYFRNEDVGEKDGSHKLKHFSSHNTDCGTPLYRPPEMIKSEKYGPEVDWFMLGVLVFESLFGYLPFEPKGGLSDSKLEAINDKKVELQCLFRRDLVIPDYASPSAKSFISSLLELDPQKRLGGGSAKEGLDLQGLKSHPFFIPLEGPVAKRCDWDKVLTKQYTPSLIPKLIFTRQKRRFANFEALLRQIKRTAAKKREERDSTTKTKVDIETHNEGQSLKPSLQHYFDNWDYVCPEAVKDELKHEKLKRVAKGPNFLSRLNLFQPKEPTDPQPHPQTR